MKINCVECKHFETEECDKCLVNRDLSCTCFMGHPPCGYCENLKFEQKD
jgi:hypothetical protein